MTLSRYARLNEHGWHAKPLAMNALRIVARGLALTVLALNLGGCGEDVGEDEHRDEGTLCLWQVESDVLQVEVFTDGCYSGSCSEVLDESCEVARNGEALEVSSLLLIETKGSGSCTGDCRVYKTSCKLEGVAAGEYRLRHGKFETTVTLPLVDGKWSEEGSDSSYACGLVGPANDD
jgi:hypothetical protein